MINLVQFGSFVGGFSIIWLIKLRNYIQCFIFYGYCIIFLFYYANIYKKKVTIIYFVESQYFSLRGEESRINLQLYIFGPDLGYILCLMKHTEFSLVWGVRTKR